MKFKKGDIVIHKLGKTCLIIDAYETNEGYRYDVRDYGLNIYSSLAEHEFRGKKTDK